MFSDTHCHFSHIASRGIPVGELIADMEREGYRAAIDIGTRAGDLSTRRETLIQANNGIIPDFIHCTCGIWPDAESIANRDEMIALLESDIQSMLASARERHTSGKTSFAALGECGLDRYWNGPEVSHDDTAEDGPGTDDLAGEEALFSQQIELAEKHHLPVIIHSRDAFEATRSVLTNMDYHRGVIHCFSYGIPEARAFLDMGWYISFPGNITFPKKSADIDRMRELVAYVPDDLLLLETDAPYMTPVPHRGAVNTPWHVRYVYEKAAEYRKVYAAALAETVFANAITLFGFTEESY
jgi:TatD DNase family protein